MSANRNLGTRLDADLTRRLEHFEERTGVEGTTLARNLIIAGLNYFEEHGKIHFPLSVVPTDEIALLAEPRARYNAPSSKRKSA